MVEYNSSILLFFSVNGEDFDGDNLEATFPIGTTFNEQVQTACVDISIINDDALEGDHSFTVVLSNANPSSVTISPPFSSATVIIEDDDGMLS